MGSLFSMDGPFYKIGTLIFDMFFLNLLWVVFSIPIVTIGASTTAMFYVCGKRVRGEEGYMFKDFWKSFKMNFKQSTIMWFILMILLIILFIDFKTISLMAGFEKYFLILLLVIGFEVIMTSLYIFPVLSKFYIKNINLIKTSFFMANKHLLTTISCILLIALDIFITLNFSFFVFFIFSAYAYTTSFLFRKIFDKYIPEESDNEEQNSFKSSN